MFQEGPAAVSPVVAACVFGDKWCDSVLRGEERGVRKSGTKIVKQTLFDNFVRFWDRLGWVLLAFSLVARDSAFPPVMKDVSFAGSRAVKMLGFTKRAPLNITKLYSIAYMKHHAKTKVTSAALTATETVHMENTARSWHQQQPPP